MGWTVQGSNPGRGQRLFSSPNHPDWLWGPPSLLFSGNKCSFPGVKLPGCESTDLHPLLSLRMSGAIPLLPLYVFLACTGENFTFTFQLCRSQKKLWWSRWI